MMLETERLPIAETENRFVKFMQSCPSMAMFTAAQIAVRIGRPYSSVGTVLRQYRALDMLVEWRDGNEIFVKLDPILR